MAKPASKAVDYAHLVSQAEKAVAAVRDPRLKRAAFEKILENLLAGRDGQSGKRAAGAKHSAPDAKASPKPGPTGHLEELVADGFFRKAKTIAEVGIELGNRGHHIPRTSLSGPLQTLCQRHVLRRQKVRAEAGKATYNYSNW
jgi:hypothetical protein